VIAGLAGTAGLAAWFSTWTGPDNPAAFGEMLLVVTGSAPYALLWMAASFGLGWPLQQWLLAGARHAFAARLGLGVAAMLALDAGLGALGVLQIGGSGGAWALLIAGILVLAFQLVRRHDEDEQAFEAVYQDWGFLLAAPAIAVLIVAACSAPGWLWSSEFGGYDAMSYHLQLPGEWFALGRIEPVEHNVYSFLPGYVEAAYYHLSLLRGDPIDAIYAAQFLHVIVTIAAAGFVGAFVRDEIESRDAPGGRASGALATALVLGTPWVVVVGSLAYNEMFVALMLITALLVIHERSDPCLRRGLAVGLLAGAACGAKLTAAGFVVVPFLATILFTLRPKKWAAVLAGNAIGGAIILAPYFIRNAAYTGNPMFPFLPELFGHAHWTAEQARIWREAHLPELAIHDRLRAVWHELLRYGIGPSPYAADEPWRPQWSILFWLAPLGMLAGALRRSHRKLSIQMAVMLAMQLLFWLFFTHVKSRFMLPAVVPATIGAALGVHALLLAGRSARARSTARIVLVAAGVVWAAQPVWIYAREANSAPAARIGWANALIGRRIAPADLRRIAAVHPPVFVNHVLPPGSHVLLVGEAAPLYYRTDRVTYQTTWDRGPLSRAMDRSDNPADWFDHLEQQGFTHVLINAGMLQRWKESGWADPRLDPSAIIEGAQAHARPVHAWPDQGMRLDAIE